MDEENRGSRLSAHYSSNKLLIKPHVIVLQPISQTGPILEQRGEEAAAAESQRVQTKKRVYDAEPPGLPQRRQVHLKNF